MEDLAYAARYGHQPLDVLFKLTRSQLVAFNRALSELVEAENGNGRSEN